MVKFITLELAVEFYQIVEELKVKGNLRDQLLRAASSISLNLSEGNAKGSVKEKKRFYKIAYASQQECLTILRLIKIREDEEVFGRADHIGACLYKLLKSNIRSI